jgi:hypothetical protein
MEPDPQQPKPPPLPPSPLTEVVEVEPFERLRLPWTTLLVALLGALIAGLLLTVGFLSTHREAHMVGVVAVVVAGVRAVVLALGAVAADRIVGGWPRMARWGLGLAILGLVPGLELVPMGLAASPNWVAMCLPWMAAAAVRDGLIGAISGCFLLRQRTLLWARCIGAAAVWGGYAACDLGLSGPLTEFPSGTERTQFVLTLALAGCLLPVALAVGLRLAWQRLPGRDVVGGD